MNELLKISDGVLITCCVVFPAVLAALALAYHIKSRGDHDDRDESDRKP